MKNFFHFILKKQEIFTLKSSFKNFVMYFIDKEGCSLNEKKILGIDKI